VVKLEKPASLKQESGDSV